MASTSRAWTAVFLCLLVAPQFTTAIQRFSSWYPRYEFALNYAVQNNCSAEFAAWEEGRYNATNEFGYDAIWSDGSRAGPLIDCLLSVIPEIVKANFAAAAIVLGLMPGVLAILGPSIQETSTLLTLGDQPLLALILCLGSPLIGLDRQLHIRGAFRSLQSETADFGIRRSWWLTSIQYVFALAAVANIATVIYEIAIKCSFSWFQGDAWLPGLWAFVGFVVHIIGALILSTSINIDPRDEQADVSPIMLCFRWIKWRFSFAKREVSQTVTVQPPTFVYFTLVGFVTLLTAIQIIFGTILFSSILFIAIKDAVGVFCRFMASVVVCRVLVLMELVMIRHLVEMKDAEDVYKTLIQTTAPSK